MITNELITITADMLAVETIMALTGHVVNEASDKSVRAILPRSAAVETVSAEELVTTL